MKLHKLLNRYQYKCKTCNTSVSIDDIMLHKAHDIRAKEKLQYFLIDIAIDAGIVISLGMIFIHVMVLPLIEKLESIGALNPV